MRHWYNAGHDLKTGWLKMLRSITPRLVLAALFPFALAFYTIAQLCTSCKWNQYSRSNSIKSKWVQMNCLNSYWISLVRLVWYASSNPHCTSSTSAYDQLGDSHLKGNKDSSWVERQCGNSWWPRNGDRSTPGCASHSDHAIHFPNTRSYIRSNKLALTPSLLDCGLYPWGCSHACVHFSCPFPNCDF